MKAFVHIAIFVTFFVPLCGFAATAKYQEIDSLSVMVTPANVGAVNGLVRDWEDKKRVDMPRADREQSVKEVLSLIFGEVDEFSMRSAETYIFNGIDYAFGSSNMIYDVSFSTSTGSSVIKVQCLAHFDIGTLRIKSCSSNLSKFYFNFVYGSQGSVVESAIPFSQAKIVGQRIFHK